MANSLYVDQRGLVYYASAQLAPGDSLVPFPDPDYLAQFTLNAGSIDPVGAKAGMIATKVANGKIKKTTGWLNSCLAALALAASVAATLLGAGSALAQNADGQTFGNISATQGLLHVWNGLTWDRLPGTATGGLNVGIFNSTGGVRATVAAVSADALSASGSTGLGSLGFSYSFNGTTWDRNRNYAGTTAGSVATGVPAVVAYSGFSTSLNIAAATTVKASPGHIFKVSVVTAGAAGQICDSATTCAAANVVATIPAVVGVYDINFPALVGIRVETGAAQVVAVSFQ